MLMGFDMCWHVLLRYARENKLKYISADLFYTCWHVLALSKHVSTRQSCHVLMYFDTSRRVSAIVGPESALSEKPVFDDA